MLWDFGKVDDGAALGDVARSDLASFSTEPLSVMNSLGNDIVKIYVAQGLKILKIVGFADSREAPNKNNNEKICLLICLFCYFITMCILVELSS